MQIHEIIFDGAVPIDSYGPGFFRVADAVHRGPLILLPSGPVVWDGGEGWHTALDAAADTLDVIFWGAGAEMQAAPLDLVAAMQALGVGVEAMTTPSACRTYNMLLAEGRRVGAMLTPV